MFKLNRIYWAATRAKTTKHKYRQTSVIFTRPCRPPPWRLVQGEAATLLSKKEQSFNNTDWTEQQTNKRPTSASCCQNPHTVRITDKRLQLELLLSCIVKKKTWSLQPLKLQSRINSLYWFFLLLGEEDWHLCRLEMSPQVPVCSVWVSRQRVLSSFWWVRSFSCVVVTACSFSVFSHPISYSCFEFVLLNSRLKFVCPLG